MHVYSLHRSLNTIVAKPMHNISKSKARLRWIIYSSLSGGLVDDCMLGLVTHSNNDLMIIMT